VGQGLSMLPVENAPLPKEDVRFPLGRELEQNDLAWH